MSQVFLENHNAPKLSGQSPHIHNKVSETNFNMTKQPSSIQLFITGGTIDKQYQTTTGELVFLETHIPQLLKEANCTLPVQVDVLMQKDSLEMTSHDRELIMGACLKSPAQQIVITHGTDTMVETASRLSKSPALENKTIVLTGAMRPFMLGYSDASFNIGCALMAAQLSEAGIYVVMNGQLFCADQVQKNRKKGLFTPL